MNQNSWKSILLLSIALVAAGYLVGDMHRKAKDFERSVRVKGLSEREVLADLAVWPIEITLTGNDLQSLNRDLEKQKDEVQKFFKELQFSDEELSIGITSIMDSKADPYRNGQYNEFRYIAKSEITIRSNEIIKIKKALTASLGLISKGILIGSKNTWRPVEYIFSKLNDIKPEMIEEATKKAKEVAEKFAQDSNSKVGKIKSAQQGLFTINDRDSNTPEIKTVRVVTTIDYYLED